MIFRALFWIAIVALLMPREPDLGLGRPNNGFANDALGMAKDAAQQSPEFCSGRVSPCAGGFLASLQQDAVRDLLRVKAEIEVQRRSRAGW